MNRDSDTCETPSHVTTDMLMGVQEGGIRKEKKNYFKK